MSSTASFGGSGRGPHRPPRDCPVCAAPLATTRLGCTSCGTEVSGLFTSCAYCGLSANDQDLLRVFLVSRGNLKEVERFLGVSYPTARQRFVELLDRLGLGEPDRDDPGTAPNRAVDDPSDVLERLATGEIGVDEAEVLLREP